MEEQLNEAWADNAKLREENSALLGRNSILEKVLALRDEQLQNLTRNQVHTAIREATTSLVPLCIAHSSLQGMTRAALHHAGLTRWVTIAAAASPYGAGQLAFGYWHAPAAPLGSGHQRGSGGESRCSQRPGPHQCRTERSGLHSVAASAGGCSAAPGSRQAAAGAGG